MSLSSLSSAFASANRGPLTTIYTPPSSCLSTTTLGSYVSSFSNSVLVPAYNITKLWVNHYSWGNSNCYPSTIATVDGETKWWNGYYYSPGICPSGWTSACNAQTNGFGFSTTLSTDTSAILCCPSSYSCFTSESMSDHRCQTFLSSGQTLTNIWVATPTPSVVLSIPSNLSLTTYVVPAGTSAVCDAIPVLWQNTDIQVLALLGQTTLGNSTVSITSASLSTVQSPTSTGSLTSNLPSSSHNAGLSAGAKAAIGVAIPIFFIFTVLAIFTFFRRRGRKIHRTHAELADTSSHWTKIEFFGKRGEKKVGGELDSRARYEADPQSAILEMGPGRRSAEVHEMGDTSRIQEKYGEERGRTSERKRIGVEGRTWFEEGRGDEDEEVEREVDLVSALSPPPHYSTR